MKNGNFTIFISETSVSLINGQSIDQLINLIKSSVLQLKCFNDEN
jgi:hypothetical protein